MKSIMFTWLKKHFIPHEGNSHQPHFLRWKGLRKAIGFLVAVEVLFFLLPALYFPGFLQTLNLSAVLPGALSALTNTERSASNVAALTENPLLTQVATLKAEDMATKSYFAHTSPEGKTPWYWFNLVGYKYAYAGENLAVNFSDSEDVTQAWMNSPTHRANIVSRNYKEIGTGMATGTYKGSEAVFVAQVYGTERPPAGGLLQVSAASSVSLITMLALSPHSTVDVILIALLVLTLGVLLIYLFTKPERRRRDLVGNGLFLVVLIVGIYVVNGLISSRHFETSFIAFDSENTLQE